MVAKSPEVKSERTAQKKPRHHDGRAVVIEFEKIIFQTSLVDRWQPLLFRCFLVIGCQKVQNRLFNGYETVKRFFPIVAFFVCFKTTEKTTIRESLLSSLLKRLKK